ncbi:hypothetical protein [Streptomyces sp. NPDC051219]|uniref:hypothetical protein n=1 Tax=Streptomyces sp. NPDC051219 TaxID=3155283 RepID=UPI00343BA155
MIATTHEIAAAQAYLRLLRTARAVLEGPATAPTPVQVLAVPMAEADQALSDAELAGNEAAFFALVAGLCTDAGVGSPDPCQR